MGRGLRRGSEGAPAHEHTHDRHRGIDPRRHRHPDPGSLTSADEHRLRDLERLRRVRDRIDRDYARPLDVEDLARGVQMSAGHLSREFRKTFGESPYSYLMTRRIERSMALLRRGDVSVTEVCFAVGFSSLGTFSTRFSELVGVPPSTYRAEWDATTPELPSCHAKQVLRPTRTDRTGPRSIRNREARPGASDLP